MTAPRWAVRAAHLVPLAVLPSSLWRAAMAVGIPVGYSADVLAREYDTPGWGTAYMLALSLLGEVAAFLTLGLVREWGRVMPKWIPVLGGRKVKPLAAVIPAGTAAVLLTLLITVMQPVVAVMMGDDGHLTGARLTVFYVVYAPLLLWGPLLGAVTWSYWINRPGGPRAVTPPAPAGTPC